MFGMCYVKQYSASFNEIIGWTFFAFILEILCIKFHIIFFFTIYLKKILIGHKKGGVHRVLPHTSAPDRCATVC